MTNIFFEIENEVLLKEDIMFDEDRIREYIFNYLINKLNEKADLEKPFYFEEIIYNFLDYRNINFIKTKKTRDFGIDGIIKLEAGFFGTINLGLQIKYRLIDSNDIDLFLSAIKNAELQLGVIICKDSRRLDNYELNTKIKAILFSRGIIVKEKLIKENININPVLILKFEDVVGIVASEIRAVMRGIYKK